MFTLDGISNLRICTLLLFFFLLPLLPAIGNVSQTEPTKAIEKLSITSPLMESTAAISKDLEELQENHEPQKGTSNMYSWISVAANIGTAVAAFLAFLALREMRRQRLRTDKPNLLISAVRPSFNIYWNDITDPFPVVLPLKYISGSTSADKEDSLDLLDRLSKLEKDIELELINAGLGPAIDVIIDWEIEGSVSEIIKELNKLNLGILLEAGSDYLEIKEKDGKKCIT